MEKEALIQLFGTDDLFMIIAAFIWGLFGIILGLIISVNKRNVKSKRTPEHFSWLFFWKDNSMRIVVSIFALIATLRFGSELGLGSVNAFAAFGYGLASDFIIAKIKSLTKIK